jgi:hypothetical protein
MRGEKYSMYFPEEYSMCFLSRILYVFFVVLWQEIWTFITQTEKIRKLNLNLDATA